MKLFVLLGRAIFAKLPFCARPGAVVGALTGFICTLALLGEMLPTGKKNLFIMGILCGVLGFVFVLMIYGIWLRYGVATIFWPALLNSLITSLLTVWVNNLLKVASMAGWVGLLLGLLIGWILCRWCGELRKGGEGRHG